MSSQAAQGSPNEIRPQAAGDFRLLASDGNQPMAYFSPSRERTAEVGVVIIHAMRGLEPFYKSFTGRFAEVGINAITFDFYGRVAPDDRRDESFDFATYYELVRVPKPSPAWMQTSLRRSSFCGPRSVVQLIPYSPSASALARPFPGGSQRGSLASRDASVSTEARDMSIPSSLK